MIRLHLQTHSPTTGHDVHFRSFERWRSALEYIRSPYRAGQPTHYDHGPGTDTRPLFPTN